MIGMTERWRRHIGRLAGDRSGNVLLEFGGDPDHAGSRSHDTS